MKTWTQHPVLAFLGLPFTSQVMPANIIILGGKQVYYFVLALSSNLNPETRERLSRHLKNVRCINCNMPVLEHQYDGEIVYHWKGNCAIGLKRKVRLSLVR
jgi:hypothetical protein